jgi:hypothetical protein
MPPPHRTGTPASAVLRRGGFRAAPALADGLAAVPLRRQQLLQPAPIGRVLDDGLAQQSATRQGTQLPRPGGHGGRGDRSRAGPPCRRSPAASPAWRRWPPRSRAASPATRSAAPPTPRPATATWRPPAARATSPRPWPVPRAACPDRQRPAHGGPGAGLSRLLPGPPTGDPAGTGGPAPGALHSARAAPGRRASGRSRPAGSRRPPPPGCRRS